MESPGSKGEKRTQNCLGGKFLKRANAKQQVAARLWIKDGAAVVRMVMEEGSLLQCKDGLQAEPETSTIINQLLPC